MAKQRCGWCGKRSLAAELTVIVPDQAKSAGTLFVIGADHIYLGPTSDLGPVDPQFQLPNGQLAAARAIIAAVDEAEIRIQKNPETYALHASLLSDISALMVQQARDALARAEGQLREALACASGRTEIEVEELVRELRAPLIEDTPSHSAIIPPGTRKGSVFRFWRPIRLTVSGGRSGAFGPSTTC